MPSAEAEDAGTVDYEPPCATDLEVTGGTVEAASMLTIGSPTY
jgi:hypothetical protein